MGSIEELVAKFKGDVGRWEEEIFRWAREGAELLGGVFQLSRFHLCRALLRGLKRDVKLANQIYQACVTGNGALADALLVRTQGLASGEETRDELDKKWWYRMARLINLRERGQLHSWINHRPDKPKSILLREGVSCLPYMGHMPTVLGLVLSGQ